MRTKLSFAYEIFDGFARGGDFAGGFNSRIQGQDRLTQYDKGKRYLGWARADEMIKDGEVFFVTPFPHGHCKEQAFLYGGHWVCNECGNQGVNKPWWAIRVFKDGGSWCCVGEGFTNLQESDNYAFGDTRKAAIDAYGDLMMARAQ